MEIDSSLHKPVPCFANGIEMWEPMYCLSESTVLLKHIGGPIMLLASAEVQLDESSWQLEEGKQIDSKWFKGETE